MVLALQWLASPFIVLCHKMLVFPFLILEQHAAVNESMIIWLSNLINCNRSAAKISQDLCSSWDTLVTHLFSLAPPFSPSSTSNSIQVDGNFIQTVCKLSSSLDISVCVFACPPSCYIAPEISLSFFLPDYKVRSAPLLYYTGDSQKLRRAALHWSVD